MGNRLFISDFKLPKAAILAVLLAVFFEVVLFPSLTDFVAKNLFWISSPHIDDPFRVRAQIDMAPQGQTLIYLLGSSHVRDGFDAQFLNRELAAKGYANVQVINLGIGSGDIIDFYLLLDRILETKPKIIYVSSQPEYFYDRYFFSKLPLYSSSLLRLAGLARLYGGKRFIQDSKAYLLKGVLACIFPSHVYLTQILKFGRWKRMLKFNHEDHDPVWFAFNEEQRDEDYYRGKVELMQGRQFTMDENARTKERVFREWVRKVLNSPIKLVVMEGAVNPRISDMEFYFSDIYKAYDSLMRRAAKQMNFDYIPRWNFQNFTQEDFTDYIHLSERGRKTMARYLQTKIETNLQELQAAKA